MLSDLAKPYYACRYSQSLNAQHKMAVLSGFFNGLLIGGLSMAFLGSYALALWYGGKRIRDGAYDGEQVLLRRV